MSTMKIHESKLETLQKRFDNINQRLKGHGQIGFKLTNVSKGFYIDENGVRHNDGLYFEVETDGVARFKGMEYLGKIDVIDGEKNTFRPYNVENITKNDLKMISQIHGSECACCGVNRKRTDMYAFKCVETTVNEDTGMTYEAGKIYSVGSSCIDKFTGVKALDILQELSGEADMRVTERSTRNTKPTYVDARKFMMYAMAVSKTNIDNMYSFYRKGRNKYNRSADEWFKEASASSNTYRKLTGVGDEKVGLIAKTALAVYNACENDYFDKSFFPDKKDIDVLRVFMKETDFESQMQNVEKLADAIRKRFDKELETDDMLINIARGNMQALGNTDYVHSKNAQRLVDACDAYFLYMGSCAMHEEDSPQYKILSNGDVKGSIRTNNGSYETRIKEKYISEYNITNKELTRLFDGYPVALKNHKGDEVVAVCKEKGLCDAKQFYKMENNKRVVDHDKISSVMPKNMPINNRLAMTEKNLYILKRANNELSEGMKTGSSDNKYTINKDIDVSKMNHYSGTKYIKGAGKFDVTTTDSQLAERLTLMSKDIVGYTNDKLGAGDDNGCILVSPAREVNGEYKFEVVYYGFPEDYGNSVASQKYIMESIADVFHNTLFKINQPKPISDLELSTFNHLSEKNIIQKIKPLKSDGVSLDESLLVRHENFEEQIQVS